MSSIFLGTTALSEFWDRSAEKIVFLGQWCLRYDRREDWQGLNYEILPHPWEDREAMHRAAIYEEEVYEECLNLLGEFLGEVHGEPHGDTYWRIILGPWLINYIQALHERYLCLKQALAQYPRLRTIGLAASSFQTPRFFWDHILGSYGDAYNLQLYTGILQILGHSPAPQSLQWDWEPWPVLAMDNLPWKKRLWRQLLWPLWLKAGPGWALKASTLMVDLTISKQHLLQLMRLTGFRARWCSLPDPGVWVSDDTHLDFSRRRLLGNLQLKTADRFRTVLLKTLPVNLPVMYLEGYAGCRAWVKEKCPAAAPAKIVTNTGLDGNESFKFMAAHLKEQGAQLVAAQHGGFYGSARYVPHERYERKVADEFWSWGWGTRAEGIRRLPSPKLSILAGRRESVRRHRPPYMFYVGNVIPRYHYRVWSCPTANQGLDYLAWQVRFLQALGPGLRQKLLLRPYPRDEGWCVRARLRDALPDLNLDEPESDYNDRLLQASLLICDMNQTTLLEGIAANIPTIAFWNPRHWELRPEAEGHYRLLREAGILHDDPEAAAAVIRNIWPEVEGWWQEKERQQARWDFAQRYALTSSRWLEEWHNHLLA